jgi:hypothetical protein
MVLPDPVYHDPVQIDRIKSNGSVGDRVKIFTRGALEAPGVVKVGGVHYSTIFGKTGYRHSPNTYDALDRQPGKGGMERASRHATP